MRERQGKRLTLCTKNSPKALFDQHQLYSRRVDSAHGPGVGQVAFLLGCFFCQDVAFESVFPFHFAGAGQRETLFGSGDGFHFRHGRNYLIG